MSTTVTYKGNTIATVSNQTKTLKTQGKYMEGDVTLTDVTGGSSPVIQSLSVTANGIYTAPSGVDGYSPVTVNVVDDGLTIDDIATKNLLGSIAGSVTSMSLYAFINCQRITAATFPNVTSIPAYAFAYCSSLAEVSFPAAINIANDAFSTCGRLVSVAFPSVSKVGISAFLSCSRLTTISFPIATEFSASAFGSCWALSEINAPMVSTLGSNAFLRCSALSTVNFPSVRTISSSAFGYCTNLATASFGSVSRIYAYAFRNCVKLVSLYLTNVSSVPTLSGSAFLSTPITGYTTSTGGVYGSVFVPSSLYNSFLTATNWSNISARIVSV